MKKKILLLTFPLLFLTATATKGYGRQVEYERIYGKNRYETSQLLLNQANTETIVLASGQDFPDAIMAGIVSHKENAGILLVDSETSYKEVLKDNTRKVILVGGEKAVPKKLEKDLQKRVMVKRLSGRNRYETSRIVNDHYKIKDVVLTTGLDFPDALSAINLIKSKNLGIILNHPNQKPSSKYYYHYTIGDTQKYPQGKVLAGKNRYETNLKTILDKTATQVVVVTGENFADALSSTHLVTPNSPIVLVGQNENNNISQILTHVKKGTLIGGQDAIKSIFLESSKDQEQQDSVKIPNSRKVVLDKSISDEKTVKSSNDFAKDKVETKQVVTSQSQFQEVVLENLRQGQWVMNISSNKNYDFSKAIKGTYYEALHLPYTLSVSKNAQTYQSQIVFGNMNHSGKEDLKIREYIRLLVDQIIPENTSTNKKVALIHDYIVLNYKYIPNSSSIKDMINLGGGNCNAYATLFQAMVDAAGIEAKYIKGDAFDGTNWTYHGWNEVKANDLWYGVDTTWDDSYPDVQGYVSYNYRMVDYETFYSSRIPY